MITSLKSTRRGDPVSVLREWTQIDTLTSACEGRKVQDLAAAACTSYKAAETNA